MASGTRSELQKQPRQHLNPEAQPLQGRYISDALTRPLSPLSSASSGRTSELLNATLDEVDEILLQDESDLCTGRLKRAGQLTQADGFDVVLSEVTKGSVAICSKTNESQGEYY